MKKIKALYAFCIFILCAVSASAQERLDMSVMAPGTSSYLIMNNFAALANANQREFAILIDAQGVQTRHMLDVAQGQTDIAMTSPTAMPSPVATPTLVPEVVARATVRTVAGPGMNTKPATMRI